MVMEDTAYVDKIIKTGYNIYDQSIKKSPVYEIAVNRCPKIDIVEHYIRRDVCDIKYIDKRRVRLKKVFDTATNNPKYVAIITPLLIAFQMEWFNVMAIFWYLYNIFLNFAISAFISPEERVYYDRRSMILYDIIDESKLNVLNIKNISNASFKVSMIAIALTIAVNLLMVLVMMAWNGHISVGWFRTIICTLSMLIPIAHFLLITKNLKQHK